MHARISIRTRGLARALLFFLAVALALGAGPDPARGAPVAIDIPAQPLGDALKALARQTGLQIFFAPEGVGGQERPGAVRGVMEPLQALQRLLEGSGLEAVPAPGGGFVVQRAAPAAPPESPAILSPVTVVGARDTFGRLPESTANVGETTTATRLPVESRKVPHSVGVVSEQLIEEVGARNPGELSAYISGVSRESDIARSGNFFVRGFPVGTRATIDGFRNPRGLGSAITFIVTDLALYERVEALKGASAILYGQGERGATSTTRARSRSSNAPTASSWECRGTTFTAACSTPPARSAATSPTASSAWCRTPTGSRRSPRTTG